MLMVEKDRIEALEAAVTGEFCGGTTQRFIAVNV